VRFVFRNKESFNHIYAGGNIFPLAASKNKDIALIRLLMIQNKHQQALTG